MKRQKSLERYGCVRHDIELELLPEQGTVNDC